MIKLIFGSVVLVMVFDNSSYSNVSRFGLDVNDAPVMVGVSVLPVIVYSNDSLLGYCNASDVDVDDLIYFYEWFLDGSLNVSGFSNNSGLNFTQGIEYNVANVSSSLMTKNENWTFACLAFDGEYNSSWLNTSVVIVNTLPVVVNVSLNSSSGLNLTTDNLTGYFDFSDVDEDSMSNNETWWYVDGSHNDSFDNLTFVGSGNTSRGENWIFSVRVFDGGDWSLWVNSSPLSIGNSVPTMSNIDDSLEVIEPGQNQTITPSGQDDSDEDNLTLVCCKDDSNVCTPTTGSNICGGNYDSQSYPYSSMNCTYSVKVTQGLEYVRCLVYDGSEYSANIRNDSYTVTLTTPSDLFVSTEVNKPLNSVLGNLTLTWVDNSDSEDGFKIERSIDNSSYSQIDIVGANVIIYNDDNLDDNYLYYYRVRSYDGTENSSYSTAAFNITADRSGPQSSNILYLQI